MSVFVAMPSAKSPERFDSDMRCWRDHGYKLAIFRDVGAAPVDATLQIWGEYRGYPQAANMLCRAVFAAYPEVNFTICAGDDMRCVPDLSPDEIEQQCLDYAYRAYLRNIRPTERGVYVGPSTMLVMQPCGDPLGKDESGRSAAERICGSPWLGRDFVARMNGRPFSEDLWHYFADEFLKEQAERAGVLLMRKELVQWHDHPQRTREPAQPYMLRTQTHWDTDEATFRRKIAAGEHLKLPEVSHV